MSKKEQLGINNINSLSNLVEQNGQIYNGALNFHPQTITSNTELKAGYFYTIDTTNSPTLTLPDPKKHIGKEIIIVKTSDDTNLINIYPVNNGTSIFGTHQYQTNKFISLNDRWILAKNTSYREVVEIFNTPPKYYVTKNDSTYEAVDVDLTGTFTPRYSGNYLFVLAGAPVVAGVGYCMMQYGLKFIDGYGTDTNQIAACKVMTHSYFVEDLTGGTSYDCELFWKHISGNEVRMLSAGSLPGETHMALTAIGPIEPSPIVKSINVSGEISSTSESYVNIDSSLNSTVNIKDKGYYIFLVSIGETYTTAELDVRLSIGGDIVSHNFNRRKYGDFQRHGNYVGQYIKYLQKGNHSIIPQWSITDDGPSTMYIYDGSSFNIMVIGPFNQADVIYDGAPSAFNSNDGTWEIADINYSGTFTPNISGTYILNMLNGARRHESSVSQGQFKLYSSADGDYVTDIAFNYLYNHTDNVNKHYYFDTRAFSEETTLTLWWRVYDPDGYLGYLDTGAEFGLITFGPVII